jgi:hypothetical protein
MLTQKQIDIIKITVGLDVTPVQPKGFYKNKFIASEFHYEYPILKVLVDMGLMEHTPPDANFNGEMIFSLTIEGLKLAKTYSK